MTRILIIQNDATDPIDWYGDRWLAQGLELTTVHAYAGEPVPDSVDAVDADALVVLGGVMSADDDADHPWLGHIKDLIRDTTGRALPTLGICLGHQLLGSALGGRVGRNPSGQMFGLYPVALTPEGEEDDLLAGATGRRTIHYNQDVVLDLPAQAVRLATSPDGSVQAARFTPTTWGVQFHPEALEHTYGVWLDSKDGGIRNALTGELAATVADAVDELAGWSGIADRFGAIVLQSTSEVPTA
ncbi:MAG: type 1 glutamine amidotransferase [Phycicoccus sp.]|nr:type 1 glutamine amidotransferase [Phycicoccus sp.]